jgi:hypothetical protein
MLIAQTPNSPNIVSDPHLSGSSFYQTSSLAYRYSTNGVLIGIDVDQYVKNIGGSGEINVTVTVGTYTESKLFTFQSNTRYEFISSFPVTNIVTSQYLNITATFPGNPEQKLTYSIAPVLGSNFTSHNMIATGQPSSTLVYFGPLTVVENEQSSTSTEFILKQNYPNPFNPVTTINYSIPKASFVTIKIYDVLGRELLTLVKENQLIGNYSIEFNANTLISGVYFYKMQAGNYTETKKLLLIK